MAFRKGFRRGFRRTRSPRKIPWRRLPRNVARQRKHWITLYNDGGLCTYNCLGIIACDDSPFNIELISQTSLQQFFGDNVTLEAMRGEVYFRPFLSHPNVCDAADWRSWITSVERSMYHMRLGLVKERVTEDDITAGRPEGSVHDPLSGFDWSESNWLKEWRHTWTGRGRDAMESWKPYGSFAGICNEVSKPSVNVPGWTMASGSGTWAGYTEPAIDTICCVEDCVTDFETGCFPGETFRRGRQLPWWRMPLGMRRKIRLRESDNLSIWGNMSYIEPDWVGPTGTCSQDILGVDCAVESSEDTACTLQTFINLKVKLAYGG